MAALKVAPPELEGYRYRGHLGTGGNSEVFLYQDLTLARDVAIKVLTQGSSEDEARVMAQVASHTHIVDVYRVGVDGGLPYLVMPLYSGPNFAEQLQSGRLRYPEVLRLGVQMSGAVEYAHRLGVLHRDIKPANILTSATGSPALSDFGISTSGGHATEQTSVSLPWVAPEVLEGAKADARSDVYSLAATLFTLCTGHAPFVVPGGDNGDRPLMARTLTGPRPALDDPAAPISLSSLLKSALSVAPDDRPQSAEALGRALQGIEAELRLAQTPLEIAHQAPVPRDRSNDEDPTRVPSIRVIRPNPVDERTRTPAADERTRTRGATASDMIAVPSEPPSVSTSGGAGHRVVARPTLDPSVGHGAGEPAPTPGDPAPTRRWWLWACAAVVVATTAVVIVAVGGAGRSLPETDHDATFSSTHPTLPSFVPKVEALTLVRVGPDAVRATWAKPKAEDTTFVWTRCEAGTGRVPTKTSATTAEISGAPEGAAVCVAVTAERGGATSDEVRVTLP